MTERDSGKVEAPGAVKTEAPGAAKTEALDREKMDAPAKSRILAKLFWSTLYLSAFTFGGGYVIVTLMKKKFVSESAGTLQTHTFGFAVILVFVVYIFAALTFFPALALGPVAEHLTLWG